MTLSPICVGRIRFRSAYCVSAPSDNMMDVLCTFIQYVVSVSDQVLSVDRVDLSQPVDQLTGPNRTERRSSAAPETSAEGSSD